MDAPPPAVDWYADACGEMPFLDVVEYNTARLERIGYLPRSVGYFRQLGLDAAEFRSLPALSPKKRARLLAAAGERSGWLSDPEAHLRRCGNRLTLVVGEELPGAFDLAAPDPAGLLERFARLSCDVRLLIGIDPDSPASLGRARDLVAHPRCGGLAVLPFLAGVPLSDPRYEPTLALALRRALPLWVHASAHFRNDVPYDIGHPRHIDTVLVRHPGLRIIIGHAGWPWTAEACIVAQRHPATALEFSTFPPAVLGEAGWSMTALLAQRKLLRGQVFFGSGAVSSAARLAQLLGQLDALDLGAELPDWRGAALTRWLERGTA